MKLNLAIPVLVFLSLMLGFSACKENNPEPAALPGRFYPLSVTRTASYTSEVTRSAFTYNANNQLTREDLFKNDVPQGYNLFFYDAAGKLIKKTYHNATGRLLEQDLITYTPAGFPDKLLHGYFDSVGTFAPHHYRLHSFRADGRIEEWSDFTPAGALLNRRTYAYPAAGRIVSPAFGSTGQLANTSEITLDQQLQPFQHTTVNLVPYAGNELSHRVTDVNGQEISAYQNALVYNQAGYPESITQTHTNGIVKTEVYTYRPE